VGLEVELKAILSELGITQLNAKMSTLSGGQRKRVALAHSLFIKPDLLILDEPTNHLDAETVEWLERWLADFNGALLLVTHDRTFWTGSPTGSSKSNAAACNHSPEITPNTWKRSRSRKSARPPKPRN